MHLVNKGNNNLLWVLVRFAFFFLASPWTCLTKNVIFIFVTETVSMVILLILHWWLVTFNMKTNPWKHLRAHSFHYKTFNSSTAAIFHLKAFLLDFIDWESGPSFQRQRFPRSCSWTIALVIETISCMLADQTDSCQSKNIKRFSIGFQFFDKTKIKATKWLRHHKRRESFLKKGIILINSNKLEGKFSCVFFSKI